MKQSSRHKQKHLLRHKIEQKLQDVSELKNELISVISEHVEGVQSYARQKTSSSDHDLPMETYLHVMQMLDKCSNNCFYLLATAEKVIENTDSELDGLSVSSEEQQSLCRVRPSAEHVTSVNTSSLENDNDVDPVRIVSDNKLQDKGGIHGDIKNRDLLDKDGFHSDMKENHETRRDDVSNWINKQPSYEGSKELYTNKVNSSAIKHVKPDAGRDTKISHQLEITCNTPSTAVQQDSDGQHVSVSDFNDNHASTEAFYQCLTETENEDKKMASVAPVGASQSHSKVTQPSAILEDLPQESTSFTCMPQTSATLTGMPQTAACFAQMPQTSNPLTSLPHTFPFVTGIPQSYISFASMPQTSATFASIPRSPTSLTSMPQTSASVVPILPQTTTSLMDMQQNMPTASASQVAVPECNVDRVVISKSASSVMSSPSETSLVVKPLTLDPDATIQVVVSEIDTPWSFYVQTVSQVLDDLRNQIQLHVSMVDPAVARPEPRLGMMCLAPFLQENPSLYYRAKVIRTDNVTEPDSKAEVLYVDFGNTSHVPVKTIIPLPVEFTALPAQAIFCALSAIAPANKLGVWTEDEIHGFRSCVFGQTLHLQLVYCANSQLFPYLVDLAWNLPIVPDVTNQSSQQVQFTKLHVSSILLEQGTARQLSISEQITKLRQLFGGADLDLSSVLSSSSPKATQLKVKGKASVARAVAVACEGKNQVKHCSVGNIAVKSVLPASSTVGKSELTCSAKQDSAETGKPACELVNNNNNEEEESKLMPVLKKTVPKVPSVHHRMRRRVVGNRRKCVSSTLEKGCDNTVDSEPQAENTQSDSKSLTEVSATKNDRELNTTISSTDFVGSDQQGSGTLSSSNSCSSQSVGGESSKEPELNGKDLISKQCSRADDSSSGVSQCDKDISSVSHSDKDISGISHSDKDTSDISHGDKDTSGIRQCDKDTSGIGQCDKDTSSTSQGDKDTSSTSQCDKDTSGISQCDKDTSGISLADKDTSTLSPAMSEKGFKTAVTSEQNDSVQEKSNTYFDILISHISSPNNFHVHRVSSETGKTLDRLMKDLNQQFERSSKKQLKKLYKEFTPKVNRLCCAEFSKDSCFYRAQIMDMRTECGDWEEAGNNVKSVRVFYLDFGDNEWLPRSKVYALPDEFTYLPPLAIWCSLAHVVPLELGDIEHGLAVPAKAWSQQGIDVFKELAQFEKKLKLCVVSGSFEPNHKRCHAQTEPIQVYLTDNSTDEEICINLELMNRDLAMLDFELPDQLENQNVKTAAANKSFEDVDSDVHWNPMEEDFMSLRNSYKVDIDDAGVATTGYMICSGFRGTQCSGGTCDTCINEERHCVSVFYTIMDTPPLQVCSR
ncbi:uncharacterized protein LOC121369227 isoform X2 [Gigantopelta aegis]|uniref:uncharacterized protein LOC121369227 isoform X2 n=1 Tax=Gigantopelta aegis TaxID=1735272 RepID=UPI001B88E246|nr:uncharacterized protein LOC121369227 isoform X2 [Gigantopelta aegis]